MEKGNEFMWSQFCKLGEMIGDGLHHEDPWISKEYKRLSKILLPETEEEKQYKKELRQKKNKLIDKAVTERLEKDRCTCGAIMHQIRSGSKTVKCSDPDCGKRYKYRSKKRQ